MTIYPKITLTLFNGFLLVIPLLLLRFGIPPLVNKVAGPKLDHFPPLEGFERVALNVYFITNIFLIFSPLLARIQPQISLATVGWTAYGTGIVLLAASLIHYSKQSEGLVIAGVYRFSRNPMYIAYFLIFLGVSSLIGSWIHLVITGVYQISAHWLILSEERWCQENYGQAFSDYRQKVRRYF